MISFQLYSTIKPTDKIVLTNDDKILFKDRTNQQIAGLKPNGLWYACGTEWIDWVRSEQPNWEHDFLFKITINPKVMLMIDNKNTFLRFCKIYTAQKGANIPIPKFEDFAGINWPAVAQDYSGIEICPYQWEFRHSHFWYYGWDVGSGCIWNKNAITSLQRIEGREL